MYVTRNCKIANSIICKNYYYVCSADGDFDGFEMICERSPKSSMTGTGRTLSSKAARSTYFACSPSCRRERKLDQHGRSRTYEKAYKGDEPRCNNQLWFTESAEKQAGIW